MSEYRIVDFAPGCQQEMVCHGIWPVVQGKKVRLLLDRVIDEPENHTVVAMVPCDDEDCPFDHRKGREHPQYFRPDELRYDEPHAALRGEGGGG